MKLLMISGDRSILQGKKGAFWYTLEEFCKHWERIDVITPRSRQLTTHNPFPNVYFHPSPRGLWYQPWWILLKGDELIKAHHHDVMTVHEYPPFYNGLGARWLHSATKIPYMTEIHHIVGYPKAASLSEWIGYWMSRIWLPRWGTSTADNIRVVNGEVWKILCDWKIPLQKFFIQSSIYLDYSALTTDASIAKQYDVVFCARLVPSKGLDSVLTAIARIPNVTMLVIGDGPEKEKMQILASRLGIVSRVKFVGWLPTNTGVYRAMQSGKIFVMNSKSEGNPRVLFEAMCLGMPIITTSVGLAPIYILDEEQLRNVEGKLTKEMENGIFTTGEPDDLKTKIIDLLSDEERRRRLGEAAKRTVESGFDRMSHIQVYVSSLKNIARRHSSIPVSIS